MKLYFHSASVGIAFLLLAGCSLHKVEAHREPRQALPQAWSLEGEVTPPDLWWQTFEDPQLNDLMNQLFRGNLALKAAWERMQQFQAIAVQTGAPLQPSLSATLGASRAKSPSLNGFETANRFSLGLEASYEIDVWQRLRSGARASALDAEARRRDAQATALALSATLGRSYYAWLAEHETLALLQEQERTNRALLDVLELRFSQASATAVEVFQQREQLAAVQALIPLSKSRIRVFEHQIAVLLGQSPGTLQMSNPGLLPNLPARPQLGVPLQVLSARPDIQAAQLAVVALDYRVATAVADQYPMLRLTGSLATSADSLSDLFSDWLWALAASLVQPLWDGERRAAEVDRAKAALREALYTYEQRVLTAIEEVENAMVREHFAKENLAEVQRRLTFGEAAYDAALRRYLNGIGAFVNVLRQNQSVLLARQELILGRNNLIQQRIALYTALGGDWMNATQHDGANP